MAEASKVRLVRCPKCENLLPEMPDFSLYKCGGCGAILKAKKRGTLEDRLSEKSEDVKSGGVSEETGISKGTMVDMGSAEEGIEESKVEKIEKEVLVSNGSSASPADRKETQVDSDTSRRGKERARNLESSDDEFRPHPQGHTRNRNRGKSYDFRVDGPEFDSFLDDNVKGLPPIDPSRSRLVHKPSQVRFDDFGYHGEGQSSYGMNSYYEQGERPRYQGHNLDGLDRIESLENGRVELLRKLDELKDRISRSRDMENKPNEKIGIDPRMVSPTSPDPYGRHRATYAPEGLTTTSQTASRQQPLYSDDSVPPYFSRSAGFVPYSDRYGSTMPDPYPQRGYPHEYANYGSTFKPEILRKPPRQLHPQYIQQPITNGSYPGYYSDTNHDRFILHRHENFFHQPACSCAHCCDNNWHLPPRIDPSSLHNRRSQNEPYNPSFDHLNPILHRQQVNHSSTSNLYPPQSRQSLTLNSHDVDSENDGFNYPRPRKLVVAPRSGRVSHPVGGGAPFITCSSCYELLKLPRKHISMDKNQQKLKCGACSSIILFELGNKGTVASVSTLVEELPTEIDEVSGGTVDNVRYWNDGSSTANLNMCSNDFDDLDHKFSPADKSSSDMPGKQLNNRSSTSSPLVDEPSPENKSSRKQDSPIPDLPVPPHELSDHSQENVIVSRFDKWNKSKRPEKERVSLDRTTSKQEPARDAAVACETDVSLNGFSNSNRSQDSTDVSREAPKGSKGGESFFAGLIKKSFRDFRKSNNGGEVGGSQVFVNGHLIPDRVVKKAEKLAGPIQPGEYWYDKQAGFWGVMGYPCLGIVMPNIEEFNYPMPKNCAAGNTGVFVNGRELNEKDLDLLSSRGLPITENRSYIIDITGKVIDEQTREELDGLGKLAPTVERAKHGFGMKVPRFLAQSKT